MKILAIGGGGYVGRPLVRRLRDHAEVVSAGRSARPGVDEVVDIRDRGDVLGLLWRTKPDVMVITAYLLASETDANPGQAVETNVLGITNLFQGAADIGVRRVVFASSGTVHSGFDEPRNEMAPCEPATLYGRMKLFNEWTAAHYNERFGTEIVTYRISGPHGRRTPADRSSQTPYDTVAAAAATAAPKRLPWSAEAKFRFIHVEDAAASFLPLVLSPRVEHRVYNSPGYTVSVGELAGAAESFGRARFAFTEPGRPLTFVWWDSARYEGEFSWRPRPMRDWLQADLTASLTQR